MFPCRPAGVGLPGAGDTAATQEMAGLATGQALALVVALDGREWMQLLRVAFGTPRWRSPNA